MLEYVYIKLVSGDDVLSYKLKETETSITLSKPIAIKNGLARDGSIKPSASAYCGLANGNIIEVFKSSCIFVANMRPEARVYYSTLADQYYAAIDQSIETNEYKSTSKTKSIKIEESLDTPKESIKPKSNLH